LGEIEAVLRKHHAVLDAHVTVREDLPGDKRLVAYCVPRSGAALEIAEMRDFLRRELPAYMVPVLVILGRLPLTPNGKLDRRALPPPQLTEFDDDEKRQAPCSEIERLVADIWMQVLNVDRISVQDNFLDLGGHSLLGMQVVSKIEKQLGLRIDVRELAFQTLGQVAAACSELLEGQVVAHRRGVIF